MREKNGVTYLDLGEGQVERKTGGWSDKQIYGKTNKELDVQLASARKILGVLRDNVREQEDRIHDMERILRRKQELKEEGYRPPSE